MSEGFRVEIVLPGWLLAVLGVWFVVGAGVSLWRTWRERRLLKLREAGIKARYAPEHHVSPTGRDREAEEASLRG